MSLSFVLGAAICLLLLFIGIILDGTGIVFSRLGSFWDPTGFLIVFGGTISALAASFPFAQLSKVPAHFRVVMSTPPDPLYYVDTMSELAMEARGRGILSLEEVVKEYDDEFLKTAVMLVVDATEPGKLRRQLEIELENIEGRHNAAAGLYDKGAALAPNFGILGTLIGLIKIAGIIDFQDSAGMDRLVSGVFAALAATIYGVIMTSVFFTPMANQLRLAHEQEMTCKEIVIEGVASIQVGDKPEKTREKLLSYLTAEQREDLEIMNE